MIAITRRAAILLASLSYAFAPTVATAEDAEDNGSSQPAIRNVLFIISDDLKASVLGCYGDPVCETPNIDRLAARGLVFDRAYCQAMWCAPSRQSLMHSRYEGKARINLGLHFRRHDWYSARVGKIYHMRVPGDIIAGTDGDDIASSWTERFNCPGLEAHTPGKYACLNLDHFTEELEGRQSTGMPHRPFVTVRYEGDGSDQPDHKAATKAIELLEQHRDEPCFLAVGLIRPHYPMVAPQQYFDPYPYHQIELPPVIEGDLDDIPPPGISRSNSRSTGLDQYPENQQRMWTGYYASVTFMDRQVGRILDRLDELGLTDSTAIVFTSDHGYHLGEHTFWQKSNLHEEVTRVPMIVSAPGYEPGRTESFAELVDLFPTLSDLAGLEIPESVQGKSLVPVLTDPKAQVRDSTLSLHRGGAALRTEDWAFIRYANESMELYDMQSDPEQFHNLALDPAHEATVAKLNRQLDQRLEQAEVTP
jgi:iduronate 2-sulfatase